MLSVLLNGDEDAVARLQRIVAPVHFSQPGDGAICRAVYALADRGIAIDHVTVGDELARAGELGVAGGLERLVVLRGGYFTGSQLGYHAAIIVEHARRRELIDVCGRVAEAARAGTIPPGDLAEQLSRSLVKLQRANGDNQRFQLLSDEDVEHLRPIEWLVPEKVPAAALVGLYGAPGAGKSFVALHLACCLATGAPFLGDELRQAPVLYVAAEGRAGMGQRLRAWKSHWGRGGERLPGVRFLFDAVNLMEPRSTSELLAAIGTLDAPPALIVFDTLHRSMPGGDDSSARDMGLVIEQAHSIRAELGATVLLVHHPNKGTDVERGSGAFRGGVDALLLLKRDERGLVLQCEKQKDAPAFESVALELTPSAGSCVVITPNEGIGVPGITPTANELTALHSLQNLCSDGPAAATKWERATPLQPSSFYAARSGLLEKKYVRCEQFGRQRRYVLTPEGRARITPKLQSHSNVTPNGSAPHHSITPSPGGPLGPRSGLELEWESGACAMEGGR